MVIKTHLYFVCAARFTFLCALFSLLPFSATAGARYKYIRAGNPADVQTTPQPGIAMMGGGTDLDAAFKWLCDRAKGGDFLIIRARGDDAYNPYVQKLCPLNSVATLIFPNRKSAMDPAAAEIIRHAEAVFIAGGDQSHYINYWGATPVLAALNAHIAAGKPIGGTSAGLAVLGEFVYSALYDSAFSPESLKDPYYKRVTLARNFLQIPLLHDTITDSHFVARDRLGRTVAFLARLMQDGWSAHPRSIAIDEKTAVLVDPDGSATVVGLGTAYFLRPTELPLSCRRKTPLILHNISAYRAPVGAHFNLATWAGEGGSSYTLSAQDGTLTSTQPGNAIY
jgi:cyanophycinase